ncbi:hypothetical protein [Pseudoduganella namucuonensis]|uniref:hypothetical protein n=1 Tax=Pseudoduganella namucuonensis TaxID=1035707 RepID=UPI000B87016C|nr:hypothetical protein [Pseudoduganella namucuonensis]
MTHDTNEVLHAEADELLRSGLSDALSRYGEAYPVGSYALGLMTWRDLDIHVVRETPDLEAFFALGARISSILKPHRMHFRDERIVATKGLPRGLYWGVYLGDERAGAWKIDVWATDRTGFDSSREFAERIAARLDPETREAILLIKRGCWRHPEYRRGFGSADVYAAVLDRGIRTPETFWTDLQSAKGIRASE